MSSFNMIKLGRVETKMLFTIFAYKRNFTKFSFRTNFSKHHSNMIILFLCKTLILYFKIWQNLRLSRKFLKKIVPSFHVCLFCCKLREKSTRVNFRENAKMKFFISTHVRGRGYPKPICDHMLSDDISVYSLLRLFPTGYCPPVGEKWESKLWFSSFFWNEFLSIISASTI